jgi:hypothetical protein
MGIIVQKEWRNQAIFAAVILMLAALMISRAFLSLTMMGFLVLTLLHPNIISQLKEFARSPLLVSMVFLFLIPAISGLWSSDPREWSRVVQVKLPLLLLPISFAGNWRFTQRQWLVIGYCFLFFVATACCWSLWEYALNKESIQESYLRAKTIPVPLDGDHVRFSWLICIAIMQAMLLFIGSGSKAQKFILGITMAFFVIYLHILSARTGLVLLYIFLLCFGFYRLMKQRKQGLALIAALILISIAGWFVFPTLQNRIKYIAYDFSFVKSNSNQAGYSDANRILSLKAAWDVLQKYPWGVGAGDIRHEINKWYASNTPGIREEDKLYPSSEWLVYGNTGGWPGVMAIACFMIETSLETQFGIFIYSFFVLMWWKWFEAELNH